MMLRRTRKSSIVPLILSVVLLPLGSIDAGANDLICGDANGDQDVNIGDVICLINYIFKSESAPILIENSDVNYDGSVNVGDAVYIVRYIFDNGPQPHCLPAGIPAEAEGCKTFQSGAYLAGTPPNLDCIEYWYDGESTLQIYHINAGFNCCQDVVKAVVDIEAGIITITENEYFTTNGPCYCLCLFDLNYKITDLPAGAYEVRVVESYLIEGDELMDFSIDLTASPSGSHCVARDHYPWE